MFFSGDVDVVVPVVVLADGAMGVLGIGPWEDLDYSNVTSWLCFSRESRTCF
jgi:hypothetical protein